MGKLFKPKTKRNFEIYQLWKEKGRLSKSDREMICKKYDINTNRMYEIIRQCKKKQLQA